jgi:hypothetical protein
LRGKKSPRIFFPWILLILSFALAGSCAPKKISLYEKIVRSRKYSSIFYKYTSTKGVYSGLETRFIVHGTFLAPEFRNAFLSEYYNVYYLDEGRKKNIQRYIEEESAGKARFVVALFTDNDRINDLEDKKTVWSVYLVTGNETKIEPSVIKPVQLNEVEITQYWFRYYDIQFDLATDGRDLLDLAEPYIKLVLASPVGRAVLVYTP